MKDTKRSFLTSCISLLLCFVMLLGTTFAWFTDVAVSANNVIQAGNLDIELQWSKDGTIWHDVGGLNDKPIFTHDAWEPGYTEVRYIKVKNEGSLAFKYQMLINPNGLVGKLAEVIDVSYDVVTDNSSFVAPTASDKQGSLKKVASLNNLINTNGTVVGGVLLPDGVNKPDYFTKEIVVCVSLHMDEFAGNEYQNLSIGGTFGIKLVATQFDYENDSFDNSYDNGATWPDTIVGNSASSSVTLNSDNTLTAEVTMTSPDGMISATLPAGTKMEQGTTSATLSVSDLKDSGANITLSGDEESRSIDVHVNGVAKDNTSVMTITVKELLPTGLNMGNHRFYHVEGGNTEEMTLLQDGQTPVHNNYEYDPATGDVTLYLKSFSEVAMVAEAPKWEGSVDHSWYDADETELVIANADQLWSFSQIVGGMNGQTQDSFSGKTVKLLADINLGDKESENNPNLIFYPIGYYNSEGTYERTNTAITSGLRNFEGTFDGNGHTISNFYHNTWEMKGDHNWYDATLQYYRDGMGLFGRVYKGTVKNLTVKNFSSDGEIATTGVIAAYADGATFENIAIFNCNPRVYNIGNGGIVGCVGWYAKEANLKTTFKNITVDNSNKISALWGSYDVACGGIVGQYYPTSGQTSAGTPKNAGIHFENCHISAQMDVYNDVCANYQYYAYRYAGMIIGSIRENTTNSDGKTIPDMTGISATGCTVNYGDWNDYYYCEFEKNGHPSYSGPDDYKFSRVPHSELNFTDSNGNGVVDADERASVTGCKHNHSDKENNQAIFLPFYQLFTGYGWGVSSIGLKEYSGIVTNLDITEGDQQESVEKFENNLEKNELVDCNTYKLGDIFNFVDKGVELKPQALNVSITNLAENNPVSATVVYDTANWENGTITFTGVGAITITIQDYYFCTPTTITVTITSHVHVYDNACDATCNICDETREIGNHVYDNDCDMDCNECGATRTVGDHIYDNACDTTCNECGATRETNHKPGEDATCTTAQTCTVCGATLKEALGHTEVIDKAVDATCTTTGLTEGKHCSVCNEVLVAQNTVAATGHNVVIDSAVAATCTTTGLTEGKHCSVCNEVLVAQTTVAALGHTWVNATCTEAKYCSVCSVTEGEALGHITTNFTGDFLYRVGNENAVQLSSLFNVGKHNVTVIGSNVAGNASVTVNGTTLEFNGTGVVKVIITNDCTCDKCELELNLEVVDATNVTTATSATANNVVLLNDAGFSSLEVSGGYTLYGNGFTLTCGSDSAALNTGYEFVALNNGTIDNVQIVCPNFDYAVLYSSNMTESGNRSETTDKTRYFNVKSAVEANGNSRILNSYISGGRAAVNVVGGNCVIENSRLNGGAVATLLVGTANSVILRDVTLVQKPTASTHDSSKTIMGFSVLFVCDSEGNATPLTIEGSFVQNAWVSENEKDYVPSAGQSIISTVLGKTDYLHDLDGDGTKESLNLGFAYMPESLTSKVNTTTITDNRTNKNDIPYDYAEVSILSGKTYVYSYKNTNGTADSFKNVADYVPNKYGDIITVNYSDTKDGLESGKSFGTDGWVYELNVDLDKASGYKLDFSKLSMVVNGVSVTDYTVNGSAKPASPVAVTAGGVTYTLTATVNGKEHTATYKVTGTETSKESPSIVGTPSYGAGFGVANKYDSDWSAAAPVLEGITIKYWSVADSEYKEFKLSDITFAKTGKQNGANSYWQYTHTDNDFTLKLTNTVAMHDKSQTFGMPVAGKDGKLYFTIAGTGGFVSNGTSSRSITIKYEFTDNNGGETLTFTHAWSIARDKDNQYNYNSFVNDGTLTKLESSSGGGNTTCLAAGTMITLADGSKKAVEDLRKGDMVMSFDHLTGEIVYKDVIIVVRTAQENYHKNTFVFDDGTELVTINEHGIFDLDLNKYVNIDHLNYSKYLGHSFVSIDSEGNIGVKKLVDVITVVESGYKYDIVTNGTLNYVAEDTLSVTHVLVDVINSFDFGADLKYDAEKMQADIEKYGLYDYAEWEEYCDISVFDQYNIPVMKVGISKGLYTKEYIISLINTYVLDDSVQIID